MSKVTISSELIFRALYMIGLTVYRVTPHDLLDLLHDTLVSSDLFFVDIARVGDMEADLGIVLIIVPVIQATAYAYMLYPNHVLVGHQARERVD
jgi:hypothetical protein